jgi:hypothetical protein
MIHRIIAALLAISLAGCSGIPPHPRAQGSAALETTSGSPGAVGKNGTPDVQVPQDTADDRPDRPGTASSQASPMPVVVKLILVLAWITLLAWIDYRLVQR